MTTKGGMAMADIMQYKCPRCDGAVEFNTETQNIKCPYCGTEFDIDSMSSPVSEEESVCDATPRKELEADGFLKYICKSCGGEILAESTTAGTACPYCSNPTTLTERLSGELKPDLIIPFKLDKKAATDALKRHYKGKTLLPKVFKNENRINEIKGLYVPFWLFDTDTESHISYEATKERSWSDSEYEYTETSHYSVVREGTLSFENVPVDAASKMQDELMESLEPYDLSELVDFKTAYLAGFLTDKYDIDEKESLKAATERIKNTTENTISQTVTGYDSVNTAEVDIKLCNTNAKYALLPVWILNTTWQGKKYTFAMNGQTGKTVGDLPLDKGAYFALFFGVSAISWVVLFLLSLIFILTLPINLILSLIVGCVIGLVTAESLKGELKSVRHERYALNYVKRSSLKITYKEDDFQYKELSKRSISDDNDN